MSKFIKYENIDFKIENEIFYSPSVQIGLKSNIQPVLLSDGSLLRYAPESSSIGSLSVQFYLTGALNDFLFPLSLTENSFGCSFAGISLSNCYLNSLSFGVVNFSPILISIDADWYGQVSLEQNFKPSLIENRNTALSQLAHSNQSYIIEQAEKNNFGFSEIFNFSYSEKCSRLPFFELGQSIPFRVMKSDRQRSLDIKGNYINSSLISDEGKDSEATINLKTIDGILLNQFSITGKINNQTVSLDENSFLQSSISINQTVAPSRTDLQNSTAND